MEAVRLDDQARIFEEQKNTLTALNRFQALIEFSPDGTIITANENFLRLMGYTLEEIMGQHHQIFCAPDYVASVSYRHFWAKLNQGQFESSEYMRIGKNGKEVWIQASYNPVVDSDGKVYKVIKFATDITEAKLKNFDYQGKISAISKSQAVIEFDLNGFVRDANPNFLATFGYSIDEVKGKHHRMFVESSYANSPDYHTFWNKLNRGEFDSGEYKRVGKGGKEIWISASYNPILGPNGKAT